VCRGALELSAQHNMEVVSFRLTHNLSFIRHIRKIKESDYQLRRMSLSLWNDSAPTGRIFMKLDILVFFENLSLIFKFYQTLTKLTGTLREKCFRLKMKRKIKHAFYVQHPFFFENRSFCEIMWNKTVEPGRPQMTIQDACALHAG
jgi:hypothetical protein